MAKKQLKIVFLGGVGEIGKNMTALEYGENILLIDCGCTFPTQETPGVDLIVPDFSYIEENKHKVKGIVITHGHEDHIGGIPFLLNDANDFKIYGSSLSLALVKHKLIDRGVDIPKLVEAKGGEVKSIGCFDVEFVRVTHSIAGAFALCITTPEGVVFHTGDYKIDYTPTDMQVIDLARIAEIGNRGVKLLLGESTNIEKQGSTISEQKVGETLERIIVNNKDSRILIATFASNVNRLQQIINICEKCGRKVAFNGRSMINISEMAKKLNLLTYKPQTVVEIDKIAKLAPNQLCILTTGSQGEPMSALTRMATGDDKVTVGENDLIVMSSSPIPGNEKAIYGLINNLYRKGARVLYGSLEQLHVSGHACLEEIKLMLSLIKPEYFIPVHGEYRHLKQHRDLAINLGVKKENIMIADIGNCIALDKKGLHKQDNVVSGNIYVDGDTDVSAMILKDRHQLSKDGIVILLTNLNAVTKEFVNVEVLTRGLSMEDDFIEKVKETVTSVCSSYDYNGEQGRGGLKNNLKRKVNRLIMSKIRQKPMVLPIIIEI